LKELKYISVAQARGLSEVRLVLTVGGLAPWGQSIKKVFEQKRIEYTPVAQVNGGANEELLDWTGVRNAPVLVNREHQILTRWFDMLMFAEKTAPAPALLPADSAQRAHAFGILNEIAGEWGFGWCRRQMLFRQGSGAKTEPVTSAEPLQKRLAQDYRFFAAEMDRAPLRVIGIIRMLATRLHAQRSTGSRYLVGTHLTASDIYWACFSTLLYPLSEEMCPLSEEIRIGRTWCSPEVLAAIDPIVLEHRDFMFAEHLGPLTF
jgi:glutathione S-transferase